MTAPMTPGNYTTDWRMVRESVAWFGPTFTKDVYVSGDGDTASKQNQYQAQEGSYRPCRRNKKNHNQDSEKNLNRSYVMGILQFYP